MNAPRIDLSGQRVWVTAKGYRPDEGGLQTYAEAVAEAYAAAGARVTVFSQTSAGPRRAIVGGVTLVDMGPGKGVDVPLRWVRAMRRERRDQGAPDFVHGTTWRSAVPAMLAGLPVAVTFHGREFMRPSGPTLAAMRAVARRATRRVAVSRYSAAVLRPRIGGLPVDVAWNGVSADARAGTAERDAPPLILSLCRLEPRKNVVASVAAAAAARDAGLDFRMVVAGRGPDADAVAAAVARHDLSDRVTLAGFVSSAEAMRLYHAAAIYMHPQLTIDRGVDFEGFGIAVADAMLAGGAVIVGTAGGTAELVDDGTTGRVVDGTRQGEIDAALIGLLRDPDARVRIGTAARDFAADRFDWHRHVAIVTGAHPSD